MTDTRQHPLRDARLALALLTLVPAGVEWPADAETQVAAWFPWVGAIFGLVGYLIVKLAEWLHVDQRAPFVVAAIIVLAWALLSRFLHFDGLADVADAYWGSDDAERRLEIMRDSSVGAFGVTALVLVGTLAVLSAGSIAAHPHELPFLLIPVVSRFSATAAAWLGHPARSGGLGRSVMGHPTTLALLIGVAPLAAAFIGLWLGFGWLGIGLGAFALLVAFAAPHVLSERFGGVTGDVMGASVLITEALFLAAFALVK